VLLEGDSGRLHPARIFDSRGLSAVASAGIICAKFIAQTEIHGQGGAPQQYEAPPMTRTVEHLVIGGNSGKEQGVLVKFAMQGSNTTETLAFIGSNALILVGALNAAMARNLIPKTLDHADRVKFADSGLKIEDYDWNLLHEKSRLVQGIEADVAPGGISLKFLMGDGGSRLFVLPGKIARYLGEYLFQYRAQIDPPAGILP
jgi:hypothetical protein